MNKAKKLFSIGITLLLGLSLAACNDTNPTAGTDFGELDPPVISTEAETLPPDTSIAFEPTETSIFIRKDGSVASAEITDFDNSSFDKARYSASELKTFVETQVSDFNTKKGAGTVVIDTLEVKNNQAKLVLLYDSLEHFMEFQGADFGLTSLEVMTCNDAAVNGLSLGNMKTASGSSVTAKKALSYGAGMVVKVSSKNQVVIVTEWEVAYLNEDLSLKDAHTVRVNSAEPVYIIY